VPDSTSLEPTKAALGPSFYGVLHDVFGSYGPTLMIAAVLDVAAAMIAILGKPAAALA